MKELCKVKLYCMLLSSLTKNIIGQSKLQVAFLSQPEQTADWWMGKAAEQ
jgi:hypothetical protein